MADSFIFKRSYYETAKGLSNRERLAFYDIIIENQLNEIETKPKRFANWIMSFIEFTLDELLRRI